MNHHPHHHPATGRADQGFHHTLTNDIKVKDLGFQVNQRLCPFERQYQRVEQVLSVFNQR